MMTMWETVLGSTCQLRHWLHLLLLLVDGWRGFGVSLVRRLAEDDDEDKDKEQD